MQPRLIEIWKKPLITILVLVLVSLACGGDVSPSLVSTSAPPGDSGSQQEPPAQTPAAATQQAYKVGDVIAIGDHVLVVLGWENVPPGVFSVPDQGKKYIAVELLILNTGQAAVSITPLLQMSMKDDTSQKYGVDFTASMAISGGVVNGELAPGEKVRGKVGFQVAENAQGMQFVFDNSIVGTGKVFVDVGGEPVSVEPPTELAGEIAQQTYDLGDVIALGTTTLTVNEISRPEGDQFYQPVAGYEFLVVDLTIENQGATPISVSAPLQMSVKDVSSQKHEVDIKASIVSGGSAPDGELAPGEKLRGQVGFQVPKDSTGLVFVFDADVWGTGKVFVALP